MATFSTAVGMLYFTTLLLTGVFAVLASVSTIFLFGAALNFGFFDDGFDFFPKHLAWFFEGSFLVFGSFDIVGV